MKTPFSSFLVPLLLWLMVYLETCTSLNAEPDKGRTSVERPATPLLTVNTAPPFELDSITTAEIKRGDWSAIPPAIRQAANKMITRASPFIATLLLRVAISMNYAAEGNAKLSFRKRHGSTQPSNSGSRYCFNDAYFDGNHTFIHTRQATTMVWCWIQAVACFHSRAKSRPAPSFPETIRRSPGLDSSHFLHHRDSGPRASLSTWPRSWYDPRANGDTRESCAQQAPCIYARGEHQRLLARYDPKLYIRVGERRDRLLEFPACASPQHPNADHSCILMMQHTLGFVRSPKLPVKTIDLMNWLPKGTVSSITVPKISNQGSVRKYEPFQPFISDGGRGGQGVAKTRLKNSYLCTILHVDLSNGYHPSDGDPPKPPPRGGEGATRPKRSRTAEVCLFSDMHVWRENCHTENGFPRRTNASWTWQYLNMSRIYAMLNFKVWGGSVKRALANGSRQSNRLGYASALCRRSIRAIWLVSESKTASLRLSS